MRRRSRQQCGWGGQRQNIVSYSPPGGAWKPWYCSASPTAGLLSLTSRAESDAAVFCWSRAKASPPEKHFCSLIQILLIAMRGDAGIHSRPDQALFQYKCQECVSSLAKACYCAAHFDNVLELPSPEVALQQLVWGPFENDTTEFACTGRTGRTGHRRHSRPHRPALTCDGERIASVNVLTRARWRGWSRSRRVIRVHQDAQ